MLLLEKLTNLKENFSHDSIAERILILYLKIICLYVEYFLLAAVWIGCR